MESSMHACHDLMLIVALHVSSKAYVGINVEVDFEHDLQDSHNFWIHKMKSSFTSTPMLPSKLCYFTAIKFIESF